MTAAVAVAQPRNAAVDDLLDRAKGLPPEFAANLILDAELIVAKLPVKERLALYEEVFRMASRAELPSPLLGTGFHTDTEPGFRQMASEKGLDSLSLQYRAMRAVKALDPKRLQGMFREMRPVDVQPQSCTEILRPDLWKWAGALDLVYEFGFSLEERAKEKHIAFLEDAVRAMTSPLQLMAVLRVVPERRVGPRVTAALDAAPSHVRGDWLAFHYAQGRIGLGKNNAAAFREYVAAHLQGVRCGPRWPFRTETEPEDVERFNGLARNHPELNLQPIEYAKIDPSRVEESAALVEFWKSEKSKRLLDELRWLNHGNRQLPDAQRFWSLEERQSVEWNERYVEFLKLLDNWGAADEPSPIAYFFMRSRVWLSLAKLVPPGPQRTNAFRSAISWFNSSLADGSVSRAEWWAMASELLDLAKKEPDLLDDVEQYGNPVLSLYAHVNNPRAALRRGGSASGEKSPQ